MKRVSLLAGFVMLAVSGLGATRDGGLLQQAPPQGQAQGRGQGGGQRQSQTRDQAAQPQGKGSISGRVVTADTGRPVKRARVTISGGGRGGRAATTDDQGRYQVTDLVAGNYTVSASKNGFVDATYGQRRPLQQGSPVVLADAQAAANIDLRLIRGGVITGHVVDEDGEPLARAIVSVQRYQYVRGERQLSAAGGGQTDDRGQYRVFGLAPGDYYVSATANGLGLVGRGLQQQLAAGLGAAGGRGGRGGFALLPDVEVSGYAPTYFPGVVNAPDAGKVTVAPGQEVSAIDFQIQLVPFATVSGIVAGAEQGGASVLLMPQDTGGSGPFGGQTFNARLQGDGTFTISNVPPGKYLAIARSGGRNDETRTAMQSIVVSGQNIEGLSLVLQPGVTITGNITVESSGTPAPTDYSGFRVNVTDVTPLPFGGGGGRGGGRGGDNRAEKNGAFTITNLLPGKHLIRVTGGAAAQGGGPGRGQTTTQGQWALKSVIVAGQDVSDLPIDLKPGQNLDNVTVVLSDRTTDLSGTVTDVKGSPVSAVVVLAFSTDAQYWRAQSRHIQTALTDASGAYHLHGLPAGDYLIAAVDDVEPGEWFDPAYLERARSVAQRITLAEGDKTTKDLRGPGAS